MDAEQKTALKDKYSCRHKQVNSATMFTLCCTVYSKKKIHVGIFMEPTCCQNFDSQNHFTRFHGGTLTLLNEATDSSLDTIQDIA
jgi:hypothetical protein